MFCNFSLFEKALSCFGVELAREIEEQLNMEYKRE